MPDRSRDWLHQAERDLEQAEDSRSAGRHEWACFAAQQTAEKAVKALHLRRGQEAWGHVVARLLRELPPGVPVSDELVDKARVLDSYHVPARFPNGHPEGAPGENFGRLQSEEGLRHAREIVEFARSQDGLVPARRRRPCGSGPRSCWPEALRCGSAPSAPWLGATGAWAATSTSSWSSTTARRRQRAGPQRSIRWAFRCRPISSCTPGTSGRRWWPPGGGYRARSRGSSRSGEGPRAPEPRPIGVVGAE